MYFTQEDYIKIENWLQANSVKDTEFPEASNLSLNERLVIIQKGENRRVKLKDLVNFLLSQADSELDIQSTNPVQNQAVSRAIYELQNRKFIKIVEELPPISNADDNVVYILLDEVGENNNLFTEWIKVNNTWEKVGEFNAEIDLTPYLKIEDSPFEKGSVNNSAVLKGGNNIVISERGVAIGNNTFVGQKAYRFSSCNITAKRFAMIASLNEVSVNFAVGDIISIINDKKYPDCATITEIREGSGGKALITVDALPFNSIIDDDGFDAKLIYVSAKPESGNIDLGINAYAEGENTYAQNWDAHAEGRDTHAYGEYSHAEGRGTSAQYAAHSEGLRTTASGHQSHAEGNETVADGISSHSEGHMTEAVGHHSHAEGYKTYAYSENSHAEGTATITTNAAEHAEGKFNKSNTNTIHSVGIGTSNTNRKNAHEVLVDGRHFIYGIGDYDGTNAVTPNAQGIVAKSVQEVINELVNIINEITTSETN